MEKRRQVFLILLVSLSLAGCGRRQVCSPPPPTDDRASLPPLSQSLKADVFIDGTRSMEGFIVPGMASRYQRVLPLLESVVERGWTGGQVTFYKFGTKVTELPGRTHLGAQRPDFYKGPDSKDTLIQHVIGQASAERLTIIVTDLFQKDVDVSLLTGLIKEKYIRPGLAVGVLGVKSEFAGNIYDVGHNNYTFSYRSQPDDPASFRPFYILALGSHRDVTRYFHVAESGGLGDIPESRSIVFSPYLTASPASFEKAVVTDINKLQEVSGLLPTDVSDPRVGQFRISDNSVTAASFTAKLEHNGLPYTMTPESPELDAEVDAYTCGDPGVPADGPRPLNESAGLKKALTVKDAVVNEATIDFRAEVTPAFLPAAGIYGFRVVLRPKGYKTPDWFSGWNMDAGQVEAWKKSPTDFNGGATYNLEAFLTNLWAATSELHRPKLAEFYCYVKKD